MAQPQTIELPIADDFHTHLRQGAITKLLAKQVSDGGVGLAYVMVFFFFFFLCFLLNII